MEQTDLENVALLAQELGISHMKLIDFYESEDDWSFIMKTHSLMEAGVQHLLSVSLDDQSFFKAFSKKNPRLNYGKRVEYIDELSLLDTSDIHFLRALSDIRNHLVHDIRNIDFCLKKFVAQLWAYYRKESDIQPIKQFTIEKFMKAFSSLPDDKKLDSLKNNPDLQGAGENLGKILKMGSAQKSPREAIFLSSVKVLGNIYKRKEEIDRPRREDAAWKRAVEEHEKKLEKAG